LLQTLYQICKRSIWTVKSRDCSGYG